MPNATCGAARSTCSRATSSRWPRSAPRCPTVERSNGAASSASTPKACSARPRELGLGDDHSGIYILPRGTPLGVPYGDALGLTPDVLIDADVTRNRPDCWGYVGVARDLAAKLGTRVPAADTRARRRRRRADGDRRDRRRATDAARFTSTVISGVEVAPSADWMARRLTAAGMRPINNVVDVSNYVMLELNQPNHAYDLDTLGGGGFRVRTARRRRAADDARRAGRARSPRPTC